MAYEDSTGDSPSIVQRELTHAEQAQKYASDFFYGLIDGHDYIADCIQDIAHHNYSSEGFVSDELGRIPESLHEYLQIDTQMSPEQSGVSTSLEFSITPSPDRKFNLESILLEPEDRAPLLISREGEITKISREDKVFASFIGGNLLSQTLRSLVPFRKEHSGLEVEDEAIALAIYNNSPESWHTANIKDLSIYLLIKEHESVDDIKRSLDLEVEHLHRSGREIVLKSHTEETISRASFDFGPDKTLILGVQREVNNNKMEDKLIPIFLPRPPHITVLRKGIDKLLGKNWPKNTEFGSIWTDNLGK